MAIFRGSKIRGEQIQDRSIQGANILQQTLTNEHFAPAAAIAESKLDINWHAHTEILQDKKIVDYVQANSIKASGVAVMDLESQLAAIAGIPQATSTNSVEGIIVDYPKNVIPFRDSVTGEPIVAEIGGIDYEVIGRMEFDGALSKYVVRFYTASGTNGAEQPYDIGTQVNIDIQYAQRFNLASVSEMFAANEKFVHGAADVTAYLNIEQVAKDLYGTTWQLDRDGHNNLAISLADQITMEKARASAAESALTTALTSESDNRTNADANLQGAINIINSNSATTGSVDYKIKTEVTDVLADTQAGKGASRVAINAIDGLAAANVQEALVQLKINAGDALVAFKHDLANTADGLGANLVSVEAASGFNATTVEGVLEDHEGRVDKLEANSTTAGSVDYKIKTQVIDPLAATTANKGASLVSVAAGTGLNAANVQGVLVDHEVRVDAIEANILQAADRSESANDYFTAKSNFASIDERFESDEAIVDANLKRVDDRDVTDRTRVSASNHNFFSAGQKATMNARFLEVETVVDAKAQEVTTARGTRSDLNGRLSVAMRADGFLVDDHKIHIHKKYTYTLTGNQSRINMPAGEFFNINNPNGTGVVLRDSVQVYINGILQANGINFTEVADGANPQAGVAVDFGAEQLVAGDVVIFEWVVNNAN